MQWNETMPNMVPCNLSLSDMLELQHVSPLPDDTCSVNKKIPFYMIRPQGKLEKFFPQG